LRSNRSLSRYRAHAQRLGVAAADLDSVEATLKRSRSIEEATDREINTLRETMAGLNAEIRAQSDEAVEEKWRRIGARIEFQRFASKRQRSNIA
jgi:hypothetical protein